MPRFRKKPVIIEAENIGFLVHLAGRDWTHLPKWVRDAYGSGDLIFLADGVTVKTLEGDHFGSLRDMLLKGVAGELYPCKPEIFEATYERVE